MSLSYCTMIPYCSKATLRPRLFLVYNSISMDRQGFFRFQLQKDFATEHENTCILHYLCHTR
jgi:hypothetical protein